MTTDLLDAPVELAPAPAFALTSDQETALNKFVAFLLDPIETVFVLRGYSGCGKSTLVKTLLDRLASFQKTSRLINPNSPELEPVLTATTNKAAENLAQVTGREVKTIHSVLGLRVQTNFTTNVTTLVGKFGFTELEDLLLFVDEASYIDSAMLGHVFSRTKNCKIVLIGDPAQLTAVKASTAPAFESNFNGAELNQVVRQAEGNPIVDLSTMLRKMVMGEALTPFKPDGHHVQRLDRAAFNAAIELEFTRPDWKYADSKILAWTNKCVVAFNQYVRNLAKGDPHFQVDDYAVCNSYLSIGRQSLKTDQQVLITATSGDTERHGVQGNHITMDHAITAFQPKSLAEATSRATLARKAGEISIVSEIESQWADLRGAYACTINKAQGSTFGSVFIDLDDISRCNIPNQLARMLYVGVSRARNHVYLCGDLV